MTVVCSIIDGLFFYEGDSDKEAAKPKENPKSYEIGHYNDAFKSPQRMEMVSQKTSSWE